MSVRGLYLSIYLLYVWCVGLSVCVVLYEVCLYGCFRGVLGVVRSAVYVGI